MMRNVTRVAALVLLIACSQAAPADPPTGSRLPGPSGAMVSSVGEPDDGPRPTDEAVRGLRGLAKCLVQTKRNEATRYLASTSDESDKAILRKLSSALSLCLEDAGPGATEISVEGAAFQGALAEAMLAHQDLQSLVPIEPSRTEVPFWLSNRADQRVVEEMAICLSDRHPQDSVKLVQSAPGSTTEAEAFTALTPFMGPCLIRGTTLHANRVGIRLALADAVYHRVTGSGTVAPGLEVAKP